MSDKDSYQGEMTPEDMANNENVLFSMLSQFLGRKCFSGLVTVTEVQEVGELAPVGMVTVSPMVHQTQANGTIIPHGNIYNLPYMRLQGGGNAVVVDPAAGDIGIAIFTDRDISIVKDTRKPGPPGGKLRNHFSSGLYIGGFLNGTPRQYVHFKDDEINIRAISKIKISAPEVEIDGDLSVSGDVTSTGEVSGKGIKVSDHTHGGVESGSANTGKPVSAGG